MRKQKLLAFMLVGVMLVGTLLVGACAEEEAPPEVIELTYGTPFFSTHSFSLSDEYWFELIEKESRGRVKITPYWGGTLINPATAWSELVAGVADFGWLSIGSTEPGFDLWWLTQASLFMVPPENAVACIKELLEISPEFRAQFEELKLLSFQYSAPYQLATCKKPVRCVEDLRGLAIRCALPHIGWLDELGAEPVMMRMGEAYIALQKGIVDGTLTPYSELEAMKFAEVVEYITVIDLGVAPLPCRFMNWDSWNSLPPDIQKIFEETAMLAAERGVELTAKARDEGIAYAEQLGLEFIELSAGDLQKIYDVINSVILRTAAELDAEGLSGTKFYSDLESILEKYSK